MKAPKAPPITVDDWNAALATLDGPTDPDAMTLPELAGLWGVACGTAHARLTRLVVKGLATRTRKRIATGNGGHRLVIAYRLTRK